MRFWWSQGTGCARRPGITQDCSRKQHTAMRKEGVLNPNPRRQFLKDLEDLIEGKRKAGYRPLVMMDMNGDYTL